MYACICHALTEQDVSAAEEAGAENESEVFRHYGVRPQCGRCVLAMRSLVSGSPNSGQDSSSCPFANKRRASGPEQR